MSGGVMPPVTAFDRDKFALIKLMGASRFLDGGVDEISRLYHYIKCFITFHQVLR